MILYSLPPSRLSLDPGPRPALEALHPADRSAIRHCQFALALALIFFFTFVSFSSGSRRVRSLFAFRLLKSCPLISNMSSHLHIPQGRPTSFRGRKGKMTDRRKESKDHPLFALLLCLSFLKNFGFAERECRCPQQQIDAYPILTRLQCSLLEKVSEDGKILKVVVDVQNPDLLFLPNPLEDVLPAQLHS